MNSNDEMCQAAKRRRIVSNGLYTAAEKGQDGVVRMLLDAGADKNLAIYDGRWKPGLTRRPRDPV